MQLRAFQMADYDAVIDLWQAAGLQLSRSDNPADIGSKLERDPDLFLVGVQENIIVGAVMGAFDGRRGWIYHLAVHPLYQGQGLGAQLIAELEERLRLKGCGKVNLLIEPTNAHVQRFYERLDYQRHDLVFMEKWLT